MMPKPSPNDANREDRPPNYNYRPDWAADDGCARCTSIHYPCDGYDNCFCRKCLVCWVERARNLPHSIENCTTRRVRFSRQYVEANCAWKYHAPDGTTYLRVPEDIREQIQQSYQRHVERNQGRSSVSAPNYRSSNKRDGAKRPSVGNTIDHRRNAWFRWRATDRPWPPPIVWLKWLAAP